MTSVVRADTDQLRAVARQMRATADQITSGTDGMRQSMDALDATWSGQAHDRGMARWGEITPKYPPAVERLVRFANELEALAQRLDDAAAVFGDGGGAGTGVVVTPTMNPLSLDQLRDALLKQFGELGNIILKLITAFGSLLQDPSHLWDLLNDLGALASLFSPSEISQLWNNRDRLFDMLGNMTKYSDPVIDQYFSSLLPPLTSGSSETLRFHLGADVTLPGVIAPLSVNGLAAREAAITKNPDGSYIFTLTDQAGVGIEESAGGTSAHLTVDDKTYKLSAEASVEANLKGTSEVSFKFDPRVPGDMTKMATFMGALGVTSALLPNMPITVSPTLTALKDNMQSIKVGVDRDGRASANFTPLIQVAGVEGFISTGAGMNLTKSEETGHWERSSYVDVAGGGKIELGDTIYGGEIKGAGEGRATLERITDLQTGHESSKVTVEITAKPGQEIKLSDIKGLVPNSAMNTIKKDEYGTLTIEYTLDEPTDSVGKTLTGSLEKGKIDLKPIIDNSTIEVKTTIGKEHGIGAGGDIAVPTQKIGINAEGTMNRESEVTIYRTPGH